MEEQIPLWQAVVMSLSLVLGVGVFAVLIAALTTLSH